MAQAVEAEVAALLSAHADKLTDDGSQRLVRHGHLPEREIMTGIGPVAVRCPRVRDRVGEGSERIRFRSAILPPYARWSKSLEVLIPILYLKGVSIGDFEEALVALLGPRRRAVGHDRRTAQGGLVAGACALEQARSLSQALRVLLGQRHPCAGQARGRSAVPAGRHRRHPEGKELLGLIEALWLLRPRRGSSNGQRQQLNNAQSDYQHSERHVIVIEPIPY